LRRGRILREMYCDEKFFRFLKTLATGLKGRSIVTRDIERAMNEVYGGTMDWFFDQWIRGVGLPQYAVSYQGRVRGAGVRRRPAEDIEPPDGTSSHWSRHPDLNGRPADYEETSALG
jgi:hypothetical protein